MDTNSDGARLRAYLNANKINRTQASIDLGYSRKENVSRILSQEKFGAKLKKRVLDAYGLDLDKQKGAAQKAIDFASALREFVALRDAGQISKEEYDEIKAKLLADFFGID